MCELIDRYSYLQYMQPYFAVVLSGVETSIN